MCNYFVMFRNYRERLRRITGHPHSFGSRVWQSRHLLSQCCGHLGLSWGLLGAILGHPGRVPRASQGGPEGLPGVSHGVPGASPGSLMRSRGALEEVLADLWGVILKRKKIMEHKIAIRCDLEPPGAHLGRSWAPLGAILGLSWGHLGAILGPSWAILGHLRRS